MGSLCKGKGRGWEAVAVLRAPTLTQCAIFQPRLNADRGVSVMIWTWNTETLGARTVLHADVHALSSLRTMCMHGVTSEEYALMSREGCPNSLANLVSSPLRSWVSNQRRLR